MKCMATCAENGEKNGIRFCCWGKKEDLKIGREMGVPKYVTASGGIWFSLCKKDVPYGSNGFIRYIVGLGTYVLIFRST